MKIIMKWVIVTKSAMALYVPARTMNLILGSFKFILYRMCVEMRAVSLRAHTSEAISNRLSPFGIA